MYYVYICAMLKSAPDTVVGELFHEMPNIISNIILCADGAGHLIDMPLSNNNNNNKNQRSTIKKIYQYK